MTKVSTRQEAFRLGQSLGKRSKRLDRSFSYFFKKPQLSPRSEDIEGLKKEFKKYGWTQKWERELKFPYNPGFDHPMWKKIRKLEKTKPATLQKMVLAADTSRGYRVAAQDNVDIGTLWRFWNIVLRPAQASIEVGYESKWRKVPPSIKKILTEMLVCELSSVVVNNPVWNDIASPIADQWEFAGYRIETEND